MPGGRIPRQRQQSHSRLRTRDALLLAGTVAVVVAAGCLWEVARHRAVSAQNAEEDIVDLLGRSLQEEEGSNGGNDVTAGASFETCLRGWQLDLVKHGTCVPVTHVNK